jgi:hypothetical protein
MLTDRFALRAIGSTMAAPTYLFHTVTQAFVASDHVHYFMIDINKAFETVFDAVLYIHCELKKGTSILLPIS